MTLLIRVFRIVVRFSTLIVFLAMLGLNVATLTISGVAAAANGALAAVELVSVVRNAEHQVVEGDPTEIRRQTDLWTFTRRMGADDPNWILTATGG